MVVQTRFGPMDCILSAPRPVVPSGHRVHGRGVYAIDIQVVTSFIPSVRVLQSCGDPEVDRIVVETLRQWRFRPRAIYKLIVPIDFEGNHAILGGR
jgi:TonB family protein